MPHPVHECIYPIKCHTTFIKTDHRSHGIKKRQPTRKRCHRPGNGIVIKRSQRTRCIKRFKCLLTMHFTMQELNKMFQEVTKTDIIIIIRLSG